MIDRLHLCCMFGRQENMKTTKPLNPEAQEYWPIPPLFPPTTVVLIQLIPLPKLFRHLSHSPSSATLKETEIGDCEEVGAGPKSPNRLSNHDVCNRGGGQKKFLPPRLRRVSRSSENPPPPKQVWQPKKSEEATGSDNVPVPSKQQLKNNSSSSGGRTTVMIKNIPNQIRRNFLINFLDSKCRIYSLAYDFLYLPIDFSKLGNLGYAFVNFTTPAAAAKAKKILRNYRWRSFTTDEGEPIASSKVVEIAWAVIQGKEALTKKFDNSKFNCTDLEFLPVLLDPPRNGLDPNPPPPTNLGKCRRFY